MSRGTVSGVVGSVWIHIALRCTPDELAEHPNECRTCFRAVKNGMKRGHLLKAPFELCNCAETFNVVGLTFVTCASIGFAMCMTMSSILDSIVATIFVCFAEVRFPLTYLLSVARA